MSWLLNRAREEALEAFPHLASFASKTWFTTDNSIEEVLLTDGGSIKVNEQKFAQLDPDTQVVAIAHELTHYALLHVQRQEKRDAKRWHTAADIVVNGQLRPILEQMGMSLPEGSIVDENLEMLSVEEVYDRLPNDPDQQPQGGDGEGQGLSLGGMVDAQGKGFEPQPGNGQPQPGQGQGQNSGKPSKGFSKDSKEQADQNAGDGESVSEVAGKMIGKEGLAALRNVQERRARILRRVRKAWMSGMASWMRMQIGTTIPDRRFLYQGLYLENYDEEDKIAVFIDTSGSVDDNMVRMFLEFTQGLLEELNAEATIVMVDAAIHSITDIQAGDPLPRVVGRGGTDFSPAINWLNEQQQGKYQAAFYFTDGYGHYPERPADVPMYWILWPQHCPIREGFGESIVMDQE